MCSIEQDLMQVRLDISVQISIAYASLTKGAIIFIGTSFNICPGAVASPQMQPGVPEAKSLGRQAGFLSGSMQLLVLHDQ